jgi:pimeloyl-ACP methyl ester carboxylesterase
MQMRASAPSTAGEQGKSVKANYKVNYIQHGERGMPIVFVHGFGASGFHWRYQVIK